MPQFARFHLRRNDLTPFDILLPNVPHFYWADPDSKTTWAGYGVEARLKGSGLERFETIKRDTITLLDSVWDLNSAPSPARLFGGFSFFPQPASGIWSGFSAAEFILPHLQITQHDNETWLTVCRRLQPGQTPETVLPALQAEAHASYPAVKHALATLQHLCDETSVSEWHQMVTSAIHAIHTGDMRKVVLARARLAQFENVVDVSATLKLLNQNYPKTFRFLFSPQGYRILLGATPELLTRVQNGQVYSVALAGSIGSGASQAEADTLADELLKSAKDRHEHALVVDAIRIGLHPLTSHLDIPETPGIRRLANIQHLKTPIHGKLTAGHGVLDVAAALHPTPALGGVPRQPALDFIARCEPTPRGWYAAPVGWLDADGNGVFAVAIRSALIDGDRALLYAGAGIVEGSDPAKEWQETEMKFTPLMDALTGQSATLFQQTLSLAQA